MSTFEKINVRGVDFANVTPDAAERICTAMLDGDRPQTVFTPNAEIACEAMHGEDLRALLNGADMVLPDGAGVVLSDGSLSLLRLPGARTAKTASTATSITAVTAIMSIFFVMTYSSCIIFLE